MSFDYRLLQPCPHIVVQELLDLEADGQTLEVPRFIASRAGVKLLMNNTIVVPPEGVRSSARVIGANIGPFEIQTGVNDLIAFRVNGGNRQILTIPQGEAIQTRDLVRPLAAQASGVTFRDHNGHLIIETLAQGPSAKIFLEPAQDDTSGFDIATGHSVLGFRNRYESVGAQVIPAWAVENRPRTIPPLQPGQIRFREPLTSFNNYFEVTYTTSREVCPRCHGLGIEYDFRPDITGDPDIVENEELLLQMVEKIILTILGSDPFAPWYGTDLISLVGTKATDFIRREMRRQIVSALSVLQNIQAQQQRVQEVTSGEFLASVDQVNVVQAFDVSPSLFLVEVRFSTRSGSQRTISQGVNFGGPTQLLSNTNPDRRVESFVNQETGLLRRA